MKANRIPSGRQGWRRAASRYFLCLPCLVPVLFGGTSLASAQTGIEAKKPVLGGACEICPWGAMAEVVKAAS